MTKLSNKKFEDAIIGMIIIDNRVIADVAANIKWIDFSTSQNQKIYKAMVDLYDDGCSIDYLTLSDKIGDIHLDLSCYTDSVYSLHGLPGWVKEVSNLAIVRRMHVAAAEIRAIEYNGDIQEYLDTVESMVREISSKKDPTGGSMVLRDMLSMAIDEIEKRATGEVEFIRSPWESINRRVMLERGDLVIVAARPSMGKSAFALQFARSIASNEKSAAAIFSMEMSQLSMAIRILSGESGVESTTIQSGRMSSHDWSRLSDAIGRIEKDGLYVCADFSATMSKIRSESKRIAHRAEREGRRLDLIAIDYIQKVIPKAKWKRTRDQDVGEISGAAKQLAGEMNCLVLALAQLNRDAEGKRPSLNNLRESGSIEQDADVVIFPYRPGKGTDDDKEAQAIIGKQRNGPLFDAQLVWDGKRMQFYEVSNATCD